MYFHFKYIVIGHIEDVRSLLDALRLCVGKHKITCGLF